MTQTTQTQSLAVEPLTAANFAPFGQVIQSQGHASFAINGGSSHRFHDVAQPEWQAPGRLGISLFTAQALPWQLPLQVMERHHFTTQAFIPMGQTLPMLVIVAPAHIPAEQLRAEHLRAFVTDGLQGINLAPGTWHHPLRALQAGTYAVVDRIAPSQAAPDCEEWDISDWQLQCAPASA